MNFLHTSILLCLLSETFTSDPPPTGSKKWGYHTNHDLNGPSEWQTGFPSCGGLRQSPIDIESHVAIFDDHLKPIDIKDTTHAQENIFLEKHAYSLYLTFSNKWQISVGDKKNIKPYSIHWHWGSENDKGSEHRLNGHAYPIEGHIVSYDRDKYQSIKEAVSQPDGLYVFGVFYKIGAQNEILQKFLNFIGPIIEKKTTNVTLPEISPLQLLPKSLDRYYQYEGSLTTPPCSENVRWTILRDELTLSDEQIRKFRDLEFDSPEVGKMVNNFRPVMNDNKRNIYASFKGSRSLIWNKSVLLLNIIAIVSFLCC